MDLQKVKAALDIGLSAVMAAGYTGYQDNDAEAILEALAELEKPGRTFARDVALQVFWTLCYGECDAVEGADEGGALIQQYAESFAAKQVAAERLRTLEEVRGKIADLLTFTPWLSPVDLVAYLDRLIAETKEANA